MDKKDATKKEGEEKKADAGKKDDGPAIIVLKLDFHCQGCVKKVVDAVKNLDGVKNVEADVAGNKLTVTGTGTVDPAKVKTIVEKKNHQKVEIVSPQPKKHDAEPKKKPDDKKAADKKPKEEDAAKRGGEEKKADAGKKDDGPAIIVLKLDLHCNGCTREAMKVVLDFDGVEAVDSDIASKKVTVRGNVDPAKVKARVEKKVHKTVDFSSSRPKKADGPAIIVFKLELHCNECARNVMKVVLDFDGVEAVDSDIASNKLTVRGKVDPAKVKARVEKKIHKMVEIISPRPEKAVAAAGDKKHDAKPMKKT